MRAAIYARVSSAKQVDNFSIPSQLNVMRAYCTDQGGTIVEELPEQGSAFQDGLARSKLNRAFALARKGQIDTLVVFSADRFTRDMADGVILRRDLKRLGVRLFFFHPTPREITSDMEVMSILTDWQSQEYVEKMREASMRGTLEKAQQGAFPQGRGPYGYPVVGAKKESRLEIVAELAAIIMQIFIWFVFDLVPTTEIARRLTDLAVPTPTMLSRQYLSRRKRPIDQWTQGMVWELLRAEAYTGVWYAFRSRRVSKTRVVERPREEWVTIEVPTIVDRALWQAAQDQLQERSHTRRAKYQYLMSRRVRCICGKSAHGCRGPLRRQGVYLYYECRSRGCADGACGAPTYRADDVDLAVWEWVCALISDPARVLAGYREAQANLDERHALLRAQIESAEALDAEHSARLDSLIEARAMARADAVKQALDARIDETGRLIDDLTRKRVDLAARLAEETITDATIDAALDEIAAVQEELEDITRADDFTTKRRLIDALNIRATLRITEAGERWADIHWCLKAYSVCCDKTDTPRRRRAAPPPAARRAGSRGQAVQAAHCSRRARAQSRASHRAAGNAVLRL